MIATKQNIIERREVPEWITREIDKIGGHVDGTPKYRVVWGGSFIRANEQGILDHPYQVDRWHLEKLIQGKYEHVYVLAYCPHSEGKWCNRCFSSGGEYVSIEDGYRIFERAIHLFTLTEGMQNKALQKNALMEREQKKEDAKNQVVLDVVHDVTPALVKRSTEVPLHHSANEVFGIDTGLKQIN